MSMNIKCKMCGGDVIVEDAKSTVGKCRYCGSMMTLPRIESEKKARLFNRANEYRLNNDFDKAYDAYKSITEEDEQEAEAYWGMILSEYGVEYVEDPKTGKRIPTCHRTQLKSILLSVEFKLAIKYADVERKIMYQDEAEILDKLQKSILSISSRLDPYDVFICYKETEDNTGERTQDSVLAQNIYKELEKENIRTFFARITLESHLGENYEPYIYAALKSARVMLVITTSGEHCEAVWVKNEWSRFLHFMSEDENKVLIPAYCNMSPYELPTEMSGFQAQDLGKVGAVQDIVHGLQKILGTARTETKTRDAKLDAYIAEKIEQEERKKVRRKNAFKFTIKFVIPAILILVILCSVLGIGYTIVGAIHNYMRTKDERVLARDEANYSKALEYLNEGNADAAKKILLKLGDFKDSKELVEKIEKDPDYYKALEYLENGEFDKAKEIFESLGDFRDSSTRINSIDDEIDYLMALAYMENGENDKAKEIFERISDYKDSVIRLNFLEKEPNYLIAREYINKGEYAEAKVILKDLGTYRDSNLLLDKIERNELLQKIREEPEGTKYTFDGQKWVLLCKNETEALLICTLGSSGKTKYSDLYKENFTWSDSDIKIYLEAVSITPEIRAIMKKDEKYDCMVRLLTEEEMEKYADIIPKWIWEETWRLDESDKTYMIIGETKKVKTATLNFCPVVTVDLNAVVDID